MNNFQNVYAQLNQFQKEAVDIIDGPVMVIAGPGTGKTQVLSVRIANILDKTDTLPDAILALTFTESAAKNMRQRLISIIGQAAYHVNIYTFHSFCTEVLRNHPEEFFVSLEAEPLAELEKIQIIQEILDGNDFLCLKTANSPYLYVKTILKSLQDLKREGVSVQDFKQIIKGEEKSLEKNKESLSKTDLRKEEKNLEKNKDLEKIYFLYQEKIKERGRFDFEDMINLVVEKFEKDEDFLRDYQERFHYFLVDEYQDTNSAQNKVIKLLASFWGEEANVFVVGDPDQSIYRFQGASLENVLDFQRVFSKVKQIKLIGNYRSSQKILDASFELVKSNQERKRLESQKDDKQSKLNLFSFPSGTVEEYFVVEKVASLIGKGVNPEEIAVLYRNNHDAEEITKLFNKKGIAYNIEGGVDVLKDPTLGRILKLLKVIQQSKTQIEDLDFFTVLHYEFFEFDSVDILKLSRMAASQKKHLIEVIKSPDFQTNNPFFIEKPEKFIDFVGRLGKWQEWDARETFSEFFEKLIKDCGYLDWVLSQEDRIEKLNRLNSFFAEVKSLNRLNHELDLESFLESLVLMEENYIKIQEEDLDLQKGAITLSTVHKAKGKEWAYVFIIKTIDGKWGNNKKREMLKLPTGILKNTDLSVVEKNDDERRLFYVAMTRAKKEIWVTYPEVTISSDRKKENMPSMFLTEIDESFWEKENDLRIEAEEVLDLVLVSEEKEELKDKEKEFLDEVMKDFKMSPTALNTYLQCPYKFKLNNLIKVPRAKAVYLSFGTAIHGALENFYREFKRNEELPKKEFLLAEFEKAMEREVFRKNEYDLQRERGKKVLGEYYDFYQDDFRVSLFTEKFFGYGYSKCFLGDISLTGKVDRIDLIDEEEKIARVVDYKTGKPKSRNFIEGETQDSEGEYKRQLVFYKLLAELDYNFPLKVEETVLDFVEVNSYGKYKKESFFIKEEEVIKLKEEIREVMKKIRNQEFKKTDKRNHCKMCEFKDHCFEEGLE